MYDKKTVKFNIAKNLGIAAAVLALAWAGLRLEAGEIEKIGNSLAANQKLADLYQNRFAGNERLKTEIVKTEGFETQVISKLPLIDELESFIAQIEKTAQANSVAQSFKFSSPMEVTELADLNISELGISLGLSGETANLQNFAKDFQNLPYFIKLSSFSLASSAEAGWKGPGTAQIQATIYVRSK